MRLVHLGWIGDPDLFEDRPELLAAIVAGAVVLFTSSPSDKVKIENVIQDNVNDQIDSLKQLVQDNTK